METTFYLVNFDFFDGKNDCFVICSNQYRMVRATSEEEAITKLKDIYRDAEPKVQVLNARAWRLID